MFAAVVRGVVFASFIIAPTFVWGAIKDGRPAMAALGLIRTPLFVVFCIIPSLFGVNFWLGFGLVYAIGTVISIILDPIAKREYETIV